MKFRSLTDRGGWTRKGGKKHDLGKRKEDGRTYLHLGKALKEKTCMSYRLRNDLRRRMGRGISKGRFEDERGECHPVKRRMHEKKKEKKPH